jgi:hypothetical protein
MVTVLMCCWLCSRLQPHLVEPYVWQAHRTQQPCGCAAFTVRVWLQFVSLVQSLPEEDQKKELMLGLSEPDAAAGSVGAADGSQFVARRVSLMPTQYGRPVLAVATHEVTHPYPQAGRHCQGLFQLHAWGVLWLVVSRQFVPGHTDVPYHHWLAAMLRQTLEAAASNACS